MHTSSQEGGDEQGECIHVQCVLLPFSYATKGAICSLCFSWGISRSQSSLLRIDLRLGWRPYNPIRSGRFLEIQTRGMEGRWSFLDKGPRERFTRLGGIQVCQNLSDEAARAHGWMWLKVEKTHFELNDYHVTAVPLCFSVFQLVFFGFLALHFAVLQLTKYDFPSWVG